jgi:nucleoside-diphosphate-sugar epimerase
MVALLQWLQYKITRKEPFVTPKAIQQIFCNKTFSSSKAIQQLGYRPTPLKEALLQTIQFLKLLPHA